METVLGEDGNREVVPWWIRGSSAGLIFLWHQMVQRV